MNTTASASTTAAGAISSAKNPHAKSLAMITSLFFFFGFITCMNDILVPHLKANFTLNYTQAILIQFAFFSSYFLVSIPSSRFCEKRGYKTGMVVGLVITALGATGFLGSAHFASFPLFLGAFFVLAAGITLIQVAANPYVTLLGPAESGSSRLNLVQAFNSLGTFVAPQIGAALILSRTDLNAIQMPYGIIAGSLFALALFIGWAKLPKVASQAGDSSAVSWVELFTNRKLMLGCLGIFAYVGAEVAIGSFLVNWLGDSFVTGMAAESAGRYLSFYWGGAMVGRFVGTPLLAKYKPSTVLQGFVGGAIILTLLSMLLGGVASQWAILAVGLCNSIMFPTIFSQSISGLKRGTEKASGLLCTFIVGGAIVPLFMGIAADNFGLRWSFFLPVLCYAYLWYFAGAVKKEA